MTTSSIIRIPPIAAPTPIPALAPAESESLADVDVDVGGDTGADVEDLGAVAGFEVEA